jgi:hypothetical protein
VLLLWLLLLSPSPLQLPIPTQIFERRHLTFSSTTTVFLQRRRRWNRFRVAPNAAPYLVLVDVLVVVVDHFCHPPQILLVIVFAVARQKFAVIVVVKDGRYGRRHARCRPIPRAARS